MPHRYLNLTPLSGVLAIMQQEFPSPGRAEIVALAESVGRVTADPLYAGYSVPLADIAKFDGYAVKSGETLGAQDQRPIPLVGYARINTGEVLPRPFDAVIMVEDTWDEDGIPRIRKSAAPGQHIRRAGEDVRAGELVLPKGHRIRPFDIGALATYGIDRLAVRSVRIGIVPTGSDLVPLGTTPGPGETVETNTLMAAAYLTGVGATCRRYGIVPDEPGLIREAVERAVAENDLVLLSAGSSAGTRDFSRDVIEEIGEIVIHGIAVRPGKSVLLANVGGKPVLGMPGYPVAAQTILREVAGALLSWWGLPSIPCAGMDVRLSRRLASDLGFDEFVPVSIGRVGGACWATPHPRGGGIQMAVVRANGYIHIPADREGIEAGEDVRVRLTVPPASIERTLICIGPRDPAFTELANRLPDSGYLLHCCNASTVGAVLALRMKTCHAATVVLPEIASAWSDQVLRYLPDAHLLRVPVARTEFGVASAEPLDAGSLASLRVTGRPRSVAVKFLLDAWFAREGIDALPSGGSTDVQVCSALEARAAGLRFTSIGHETCDLVVREEFAADEGVAALIEAARSPEFRAYLRAAGRDPGEGDAPGTISP